MTAFIFPPLILYLLIKGKKQSQGKRFIDFHFIFLVSSWCLLIFSHNISALLYSPILLFLGFALYRKQLKLFITYVVYPYFLAVLITSFFWMPAIMLSKYIRYPALINSEIAVRAAYYKPLGMLVRTAFDSIQAGQTRYTDFTMGIPILIAGISVVILGLIRIKKVIKNHTLIHIDGVFVGILLFFFAFALYCMDHASDWIWRTKLFNYVVYPYRFLVIVTFTGSLLAGYVARKRFLMVLLFLTISFICAQPYLNPYASILPFSYEYFTQPQTVLHAPGTNKGTSMAEFLPIWTDMDYLKSIDMKYLAEKILPEPVEIPDGGKLISVEKNMEDIKTIIELNKSTDVPFNTLYFPNWKGYVDAREVILTKDSYGRILVPVPAGSHTIELIFGISQIEVIGIILSGIGVVVLGVSAFHQYISTDYLNRRKDHKTGRVSL
jgi:hypothetical protein